MFLQENSDPPKQNGIKSENVGEVKKDYGAEPEDKIAVEKLTKPVGNGESIPGYPGEILELNFDLKMTFRRKKPKPESDR